jgi:hypothetical protein
MSTLTRTPSLTVGTRTIEAGEEVKVAGERGRFRFLAHVTSSAAQEWVDVWGPASGAPKARSFTIDRIRPLPRPRGQR